MKSTAFQGLLVLDKPGGLTSRAVVNRVLKWFPRGTRVGHTGTLDPLATGVLVLCVGQATRLTEYVQRMSKTYRAGILLGARSDTDDADGTIEPCAVARPQDRAVVTAYLQAFVGEIEQVPPAYSAARVAGRRAYDLARRGHGVELKPRRVRIHDIKVLAYEYPRLEIEVHCGKGTYIRSLARDLGERLGCGALVETLRRTRVGPFLVEDALPLDVDEVRACSRLLPLATAVADLPNVTLQSADVARIRHGQAVALPESLLLANQTFASHEVAVFDPGGTLAAVAVVESNQRLVPTKVLA